MTEFEPLRPPAARPSRPRHLLLAAALRDGLDQASSAVVEAASGLLRRDLLPGEVVPAGPLLAAPLLLADLARILGRLTAKLRRPGVLVCAVRQGPGCLLWAGRVPPSGPTLAVLPPITPPGQCPDLPPLGVAA